MARRLAAPVRSGTEQPRQQFHAKSAWIRGTGALAALLASSCADTRFNNQEGFAAAISIQSFDWEDASTSVVRDDGSVVPLNSSSPTALRDGQVTVIVENVPPEATATIHTNEECAGESIAEISSDADGSLSLSLDLSSFSEGPLNLYAEFHKSGVDTPCGFTGASFIIDRTAPDLIPPADDAAATVSKNLAWSCGETGCTYRWMIDSSATGEPTGEWSTATSTVHASGNGTLYFHLQGRDSAGNISATRHASFVMDTAPPAAPTGLALVSPAASPSNDATPTIRVSGVNSGDSVGIYSSSTCSIVALIGSGTATGTTIDITPAALTDGVHTFYARANDPVGNASTCSTATLTYELDTAPPTVTGISDDLTPAQSRSWTWSCTDAPCTYRYAIDTGAATSPGGAYGSATTANESGGDGTFYVHVQAMDEAGNESPVVHGAILLDNTAPSLTGLSDDAVPAKTKYWSWSCNEAPCTYQYLIDTSATGTPSMSYASTTSASQSSGTGSYYLHIRAKDAAGNVSSIADHSAVLDNTPPPAPNTLALQSPSSSPGSDTTPTIRVGGIENGDAVALYAGSGCSLVNLKASGTASGTEIDLTSSELGAGAHTFYATATDAAGNTSSCSTATVSYTVDTSAPAVTGLSDDSTATKSKTWSWGCSEAPCTYRHVIDTTSNTAPTGAYDSTTTDTQATGDGTFYLHVQAKDASGVESSVVHVSALLDNSAPATPSGLALQDPASSPSNDTTPTIRVSGVASGDVIGLYTDSACTGTLSASGTASGASVDLTAAALLAGTYTFYAKATDAAGNASSCSTASVGYTIDTTAPAAPSSLALFSPNSTPGADTTPEVGINVTLETGAQTAKLYKATTTSDCTSGNYLGTSDTLISANLNVTSSALAEGTYRLRATTQDSAGNVSACSTAFVDYTVDTTAPSLGATPISIESGATHSWDKNVDVALSATGATQMCLAKNSDCSGCVDTAYAATMNTSFSSGSGVRSMSAIFKDAAGNATACQTDSIQVTDLDAGPTPVYTGKGSFFDRIDKTAGTDCSTAGTQRTEDCLIGGDQLKFVTAYTSCSNLTLSDSRSWASWKCVMESGVAVFYASIDSTQKRLTDYMSIGGASPAWNTSALTLTDNGTSHAGVAKAWWSDTLAWAPDSSASPQTLSSSGTIYVSKTTVTSRGLTIGADRVALVGPAGASLVWDASASANCGSSKCLVQASSRASTIVQIDLNGNHFVGSPGADHGVYLTGTAPTSSTDGDVWVGKSLMRYFNASAIFTSGLNRTRITSVDFKFTNTGVSCSTDQGILIKNARVASNTTAGIHCDESLRISMWAITVADSGTGIRISEGFSGARLFDIKVSNSTKGIHLEPDTTGVVVAGALLTHLGTGIHIEGASDVKIMGATIAKTLDEGLLIYGAVNPVSDVVLYNVLLANTGSSVAAYVTDLTGGLFFNYISAGNSLPWAEVVVANTSNLKFRGNIAFTQTTDACDISSIGAGGGNDLNSWDCATSSGTRITGFERHTAHAIQDAFMGAPAMLDNTNGRTTNQRAYTNAIDFWNFIGEWRAWGDLGSGGTDPMLTGLVSPVCTSGDTCQIWDWSLKSTGEYDRRSDDYQNDSTNFTVGGTCPSQLTDANSTFTIGSQTVYRLAIESILDGIGDDDGYCETGETCLYTPNYGYFQGQYATGVGTCDYNGDANVADPVTFRGFGSAAF